MTGAAAAPPGTGSERPTPATSALAAAALAALALPRPALAVIAAAPTFLVAHRAGPREIWVLLTVTCVLVPALAAAVGWFMAARTSRASRFALSGGLGLLMALAAMPVLVATGLPGAWLAALGLGALFGWAWWRRPAVRWLGVALSPALLAVPLAFALHPDVRRATTVGEGVALAAVESTTPVVLVVLDEWTFGSLLAPDWVLAQPTAEGVESTGWEHALDRARLPRLTAFAATATWFANARAVSDATELAVPAILTGRFPRAGAPPVLAEHPDNLFTRLGGSYRVAALEPVSSLCPPGIDRLAPAELVAAQRLAPLLQDVAVVWLHAVAPRWVVAGLPPIAQKWSGFLGSDPDADAVEQARRHQLDGDPAPPAGLLASPADTAFDRVEAFRRLIAAIEPGERQLYVAHLLLPHVPLEYLPSGARYPAPQSRLAGLQAERWGDDQRLADQALQRYLLQVSFVDGLLGELFDRLEEVGLFDESLVVLASDHGASFRAGAARRMFEPANAADVVPVPLFVKLPGQRAGEVRLEPATTLDVLPTVLDALGLAHGPGLDGRSLLAARPDDRHAQELRFWAKHLPEQRFPAGVDPAAQRVSAARRQSALLARAGGDPFGIGLAEAGVGAAPAAAIAPAAGDLARAVADGGTSAGGQWRAGGFVEGSVHGLSAGDACCWLAAARDGEIVAAGPIHEERGGRVRFSLVLPPAAAGGELSLHRVDRRGALHPVAMPAEPASLELSPAGELVAVTLGGTRLPADPAVEGFLESVFVQGGHGSASGWATDGAQDQGAPAAQVLLFLEGELVGSGPIDGERPDVALARGVGTTRSGFEVVFDPGDAARLRRSGLTAVAVSEERSARLVHFYAELHRDPAGGGTVRSTDGRDIPLRADALQAWLEAAQPSPASGSRGGALQLVGWAADLDRRRSAERVVAFENGAFVAHTWPGLPREDLAAVLGADLREVGFVLELPRASVAWGAGALELIAISHDGEAAVVAPRPGLLDGLDAGPGSRAAAPP